MSCVRILKIANNYPESRTYLRKHTCCPCKQQQRGSGEVKEGLPLLEQFAATPRPPDRRNASLFTAQEEQKGADVSERAKNKTSVSMGSTSAYHLRA